MASLFFSAEAQSPAVYMIVQCENRTSERMRVRDMSVYCDARKERFDLEALLRDLFPDGEVQTD